MTFELIDFIKLVGAESIIFILGFILGFILCFQFRWVSFSIKQLGKLVFPTNNAKENKDEVEDGM